MTTVDEARSQRTRLLGNCTACALPLPLRLPEAGEQPRDWLCAGCGRSYRGVLLESWPAEFRQNVQPAAPEPDPHSLSPPRQQRADLVVWPDARQPRPISVAFPNHRVMICDLETGLSRELDAEIGGRASLRLQPQGDPFADAVQNHGDQPYDQRAVARFAELIHHVAEQMGDLFTSLEKGASSELTVARAVSQDGLSRVAEDMDLLVGMGITPSAGGYPSRHSLRVGMLAMSLGANLGWDEQTLLDLGVGCLLHDVGMLRVQRATYRNKRFLLSPEFAEVVKHPLLTFELLKKCADRVPDSARMVAYQMHERCDGSGYPRGYAADQIHDLAKIAAVADVFVALVSPRPHRPGLVPYHAMEKILHDTKNGLYDTEVMRALLKTVSLFPIGSYVRLSDGRVARVIRAGGEQYDRPIVEIRQPADATAGPVVVDLSEKKDLRIAGVLPQPSY
jgi:HD-GYP domain-containing protein (c-di-GMP phosphodiesterase class II)